MLQEPFPKVGALCVPLCLRARVCECECVLVRVSIFLFHNSFLHHRFCGLDLPVCSAPATQAQASKSLTTVMLVFVLLSCLLA